MFRAGILASFVVVALAFDPGRAPAQVIASAGPLSNADRGIAAPIVRITSRRLPFEGRDLLLVNCAWAEQDFVGMVTAAFPPYGCVRHMSGTLERMDADSIVIVRNGRPMHVALSHVRMLEEWKGRNSTKAAIGAVEGAAVGAVLALFAAMGTHSSDANYIKTSLVLGAGGAAVGAYIGGQDWKRWWPPPTYTPPFPPPR